MKITKEQLKNIILEELKIVFEQEGVENLSGGNVAPLNTDDQAEKERDRNKVIGQIKVLQKQLDVAKEQIKTLPQQISDLNKQLLSLK